MRSKNYRYRRVDSSIEETQPGRISAPAVLFGALAAIIRAPTVCLPALLYIAAMIYLFSDYFRAAHVLFERFRDLHAAVSLLVVFEYRCGGTTDRQTGAVERVYEFCLAAFSSKPDIGASCLIIQEVGAGGDLHISAVARHPYFDVVCHR